MTKIDKNINGNPLGPLFYILSTSTDYISMAQHINKKSIIPNSIMLLNKGYLEVNLRLKYLQLSLYL